MRPSAISRALTNCTAPLFVPVRWLSAPYKQLELRAVGVHLIEMNAVDVAGVVPAAEQHLAVVEHRRLVVAALIERHLLELVAAVVAHDVQNEGRLLPIFVARVVLRLAVVDENRFRRLLPRRHENDAAVGQIVRRKVVALLRREVGDDEAPQPCRSRSRTPRCSTSAGLDRRARGPRRRGRASRTASCGRRSRSRRPRRRPCLP